MTTAMLKKKKALKCTSNAQAYSKSTKIYILANGLIGAGKMGLQIIVAEEGVDKHLILKKSDAGIKGPSYGDCPILS
jgi:hypothetical protein